MTGPEAEHEGFLRRLWRKVIAEPFHVAEEEARVTAETRRGPDFRVMVVLVTTALSVTLLEYVGMSNEYGTLAGWLRAIGLTSLGDALVDSMTRGTDTQLARLTYWAAGCFVSYFVLPALVIRFVLRERISDFGLRLGDSLRDAWIYLTMFAVVLPLVILVSFDAHFQETYPFYELRRNQPLWPKFWIWEVLYFSQFFALEFFFRGFMVHGLRHRFGFYSVFVMTIPYCMIHFGKPLPETIGAIIAGVVLGSLSLKARSIWLGVAIHASVALSMDFASLWQRGYFFR